MNQGTRAMNFQSRRRSPRTHHLAGALWLTLAITVVVIFLAARSESLKAFDAVAAVVTMFFLCTYGMVNLAAFVESFGANPSFRPRFRFFHWTVSLVGAIECLVIMFLIDARAAVVSALVIAGLYLVISRRMHRSAFGDARRGFLYSVVARNLQRLRVSGPDPKNWRPTLLVLSGNPMTRAALLRFGAWFGAGRGIVTAVQIVIGCIEEMEHLRKTALSALEKVIQEGGWDAFPEVLITRDIDEGIRTMVQAYSIGPIKPNAVLIGWPSDPQRVAPWARHLRDIRSLGRSVISVIDRGTRIPNGSRGRIDVWWRGKENGSLPDEDVGGDIVNVPVAACRIKDREVTGAIAIVIIHRRHTNPSLTPCAADDQTHEHHPTNHRR